MTVLEAVVDLLHLAPIHIAALLGVLEPSQLRVRLHHGVDGLAYRFLIDLLEVDLQTIGRLDRQLALMF
ncbi:hypothetical protein D3C86_1279060 [compost metagenome]